MSSGTMESNLQGRTLLIPFQTPQLSTQDVTQPDQTKRPTEWLRSCNLMMDSRASTHARGPNITGRTQGSRRDHHMEGIKNHSTSR